jgi:predicted enzyme related to lactoylglutathione lyase
MMNKTKDWPQPLWLYYFYVDDIDAASARVGGAGGQVLNGPQEVPGGAWIIQCLDPQGAMFALVGPRR